ncbi:MAG: SusC/RagA family TonB-linked outer membrane protein, partial [Candidatus Cryptobacteroides sp.]
MKLFRTLLAVIVMAGFSISLQAQNVTIHKDQVTLETVLDELSSQTGYSFLHSRPTVNPDSIVSLNVKDVTLKEALNVLFSNTKIAFEIKGTKVYLTEKTQDKDKQNGKKKLVSGVAVDQNGFPVIGAGVLVKGTTRGVSTGLDGDFFIEVSEDETLLFSCIGYDDVEILVGGKENIDVVMNESSMVLSDVVVIGYGAVKKRDVSTAISSIKSEDIANHSIADFRQAMVGKMPGVSVMQTSGDPEGSVMVRVRGIGSATAGNDPLYVIDGVPVESGLSNINANDIESMEVLKDASSAAIYGSRGSNGVILVTTKKGSSDRLRISYDGYYALDMVSKKIDMMDAYEYAQFVKEGHDNAYHDAVPGGTEPNGSRADSWANYPVEIIPYLEGQPGLTNTDWQDQIFRKAHTHSHNLSFSGKTDAINYFISGNVLSKQGVIINSDYTKYALRFNLDGKRGNFKYGVNFAPSYSKSNRVNASGAYGSGGVVQSALAYNPMWPVYNEDGSFNFLGNGYWRIGNDYQHNEILNPVALATLKKDIVERVAMTGRVFASYEFFDGFSFQTSLGGSYYGASNDQYTSQDLETLGKANYGKKSNPIGYASSAFQYNWLWENQFTFNRTFNDKHMVNAVLVHSLQKDTQKKMNVTATDYPNDYIQTIGGGVVNKGDSNTEQWSLAS